MQTFVPTAASYWSCGVALDRSRLGNQIWREGWPLCRGKWPNHPASRMWRGHERALCEYLEALVGVLHRRSWARPQTIYWWSQKLLHRKLSLPDTGPPPWWGQEEVHSSHRRVLLGKNPEWYGRFGWSEQPGTKEDYVWPV